MTRSAATTVDIDVSQITLMDATGERIRLGDLPGTQLLLLMRHRH